MAGHIPSRRVGAAVAIASALACASCAPLGNGAQPPVTVTQTVTPTAAETSSSGTAVATTSTTTSGTSSTTAPAPPPASATVKAPPSWAAAFSTASTGVVRIDSICDTATMSTTLTGTGFLIAPNLVATVAHVVEGGGALRVTSPTSGLVSPAQVIGYDHDDDLALVQTVTQLPGHIFTIASRAPEIGTEMAAIGFPLGRSMQLTVGHITGTHDHRPVGGEFDLSNVLLSDAALNPGNSGGPWITSQGEVIALDESGPPFDQQAEAPAQGNNGGVSALDARSRFSEWSKAPEPEANRGCQPAGPTEAAVETLELYFAEVNESDYASAYAQLWSDNSPVSGLGKFIDGVQSSTVMATDGSDADFAIADEGRSKGQVYLDATFRSRQHASQGPAGETCTDWTLRYTFRNYFGVQMIDSSEATPGTPGHRPC